jgi:hypothetical protein
MNYDKSKVLMVDPKKLVMNPENPRPVSEYSIEPILATASIVDEATKQMKGIHTPLFVEQNTNKILRGHRRATAAVQLNLEAVPVIYMDTSKMSPSEVYEFMLDHSSELPLSKAGAFRSIQKLFRFGFGEMAVLKRVSPILNLAFGAPAPEKIADARLIAERQHEDPDAAEFKVLSDKHRGTLQNMKRLSLLPDAVGDEYIKSWQGKDCLLTQKDIKILDTMYNDLWKADPTLKRDNPPIVFIDKMNELQAVNSEPEPEVKKTVKRTKNDVENMMKACENAIVRKTLSWVLGETKENELLDFVR